MRTIHGERKTRSLPAGNAPARARVPRRGKAQVLDEIPTHEAERRWSVALYTLARRQCAA
jgi:hypothetical protein